MKKNTNLTKLFDGLQKQMETQLVTNRAIINHPGTKGDSLEDIWISWLRKYLPNRYCVDKAIIIDSNGDESDQIDLVIYDQQYTPFVFHQNEALYIPAEGVYAVFEVKPDFKGTVSQNNYIKYASGKIESVRRLIRTSTTIIDRGMHKPARSLTKIIGGILAGTNSYKQKGTLEKHLKATKGLGSIDMGCAMEFGSFYIDYNGLEEPSIQDVNKRIHQYYQDRAFSSINFSHKDKSLVTFFLQLSRYLQQSIGTVAAIDFNAYAQSVNFQVDEEI